MLTTLTGLGPNFCETNNEIFFIFVTNRNKTRSSTERFLQKKTKNYMVRLVKNVRLSLVVLTNTQIRDVAEKKLFVK